MLRIGFFVYENLIEYDIPTYDSLQDISIGDKSYKKELENKFSISIETSEISRINAANGAPVKVSNETLELLHTGIYYGQLSNGCFDITIAPLTSLWNFDKQSQKIPSDVDIETALTHVNYKNIKIAIKIAINTYLKYDFGIFVNIILTIKDISIPDMIPEILNITT